MRIVVLMGSPNLDGSTAIMAKSFVRGAEEKGHECEVFNVCGMDVHPCKGCLRCGYEGPCSIHDDGDRIRSAILSSDMLVFASPLYYFGFSAQMKAAIDRFCSYNSSIHRKDLRSCLLTVAWNSDDWTFDLIVSHYRTLVRYLGLRDGGMVLGVGCGTPDMTRGSRYPAEAYDLGRSPRSETFY